MGEKKQSRGYDYIVFIYTQNHKLSFAKHKNLHIRENQ